MPAGDALEQLLAARYPDPETGEPLAASSRAVAIEPSLDGAEVELIKALDLGPHLAVVSDQNTHDVLGHRVERALGSRYAVQRIVLDRDIHADAATIDRLHDALDAKTDAIVAVGSGTLNDTCKMVAVRRDIPQVVFATAPSMNGYTSLSASISEQGFKRSVRAKTPVGVFFELRVLAAAPVRLIRAGLGDSLCRPTAQADWLLSHFVLGRPYREAPFAMLAADEAEMCARAGALVAGDLEAMRHLARTLVLSGFGMTIAGGSFPASQGEHLLSHYIDLMGEGLPPTFHGEQTAVGAIAMARLQDRILELDRAPVLHASHVDRAQVVAHFGPEHGEAAWREFEQKQLTPAQIDDVNARLAHEWPALRDRLVKITLGATRMTEILNAAGAPVSPDQLGWPRLLWANALAHARLMRNRYTFLDFAADLASGADART